MYNHHHTLVPKGYVSLNQACRELEISRPTLNRWIKKLQGISKVIVNEVHYIHESDVDKIRKARQELSNAANNA